MCPVLIQGSSLLSLLLLSYFHFPIDEIEERDEEEEKKIRIVIDANKRASFTYLLKNPVIYPLLLE